MESYELLKDSATKYNKIIKGNSILDMLEACQALAASPLIDTPFFESSLIMWGLNTIAGILIRNETLSEKEELQKTAKLTLEARTKMLQNDTHSRRVGLEKIKKAYETLKNFVTPELIENEYYAFIDHNGEHCLECALVHIFSYDYIKMNALLSGDSVDFTATNGEQLATIHADTFQYVQFSDEYYPNGCYCIRCESEIQPPHEEW